MPHPQAAHRPLSLAAAATLLLLVWGAAAPDVSAEESERDVRREEEAANLLADANEQLEQRRYALAAESARRAMALAESAHVKGNGAILLGQALHRQWSLGLDDASDERLKSLLGAPGGPRVPPTPDDELLADAAEAFRQAVEVYPEGRHAGLLKLVLALYYLRRDDEAGVLTADYVQRGGPEPELLRLHSCLHLEEKDPAYRVGGAVARPEKIGGANPSYHDLPRAFGVEGTVIIEAVIDEAGDVRCLRPLKRLPLGLTEAAIEAVRAWKFKPATLGGEPVKVYYTLTVNFSIDRKLRPPRPD